MKTVIVLVILTVCSVQCSVQVIKMDNNLIADAINSILEGYFEPRESKVDLFYYGVQGGSSEKIVEAILRSKSSGVSIKVVHVQPENDQPIVTNLASIHIFDSFDVYGKTYEKIRFMSSTRHRYEQLIYISDLLLSQLKDTAFKRLLWYNVNFLFHKKVNSEAIELISQSQYKPPPLCNDGQPTTINRYTGETKRWDNSSFFPKDFQNFHGCPVECEEISEDIYNDSKIQLIIFDTLMKHLNIKLQSLGPNVMKFASFYCEPYVQNDFKRGAIVIGDDELIIIIPPGKPYTQFEKMFLMFQTEVWIAIGGTFIITLTIIQVINRMSIKVQNLVYGRNIRTPTLNLTDIFLNGGQHRVPQRNFARFILILFVVWSLVIRTCYQSTLYALLQTDLRKPRFETIDQLVENNFTLCFHPHIRRRQIDVNPELSNKFKKTMDMPENSPTFSSNHKSKCAFIGIKSDLTHLLRQKEFHGKEAPYYVLPERIRSMHWTVRMGEGALFLERFNELIGRMIQHGLIVHWNSVLHGEDPPKKPDEPEAQVLSMKHMGIGFIIIFVLLGLSLVVFVIEHFANRLNMNRIPNNREDNYQSSIQTSTDHA